MRKHIIVIFIVFGIVTNSVAGNIHFLKSNVWPVYEFDESQNPNQYYWCGHTALQIVAKYVTGEYRTLSQIHRTFWKNSAGYRANNYCYDGSDWCAKLQDLLWMAQKSQNGGYGYSKSVVRVVSTYSKFYKKVKDGIVNDLPIIVPSRWYYGNAGHFWIIVGYEEADKPEDVLLYLRDVAEEFPNYVLKYDRVTTLKEFFDDSGYNRLQLLYIKRN